MILSHNSLSALNMLYFAVQEILRGIKGAVCFRDHCLSLSGVSNGRFRACLRIMQIFPHKRSPFKEQNMNHQIWFKKDNKNAFNPIPRCL